MNNIDILIQMSQLYGLFFVLSYIYPYERQTHVAHLIELGFSPVEIAERMGHEGINITFNYAHLYPSKQVALAEKLNEDRGNIEVIEDMSNEDIDE